VPPEASPIAPRQQLEARVYVDAGDVAHAVFRCRHGEEKRRCEEVGDLKRSEATG